tara:strand:- start:255 stop:932 length:678 start_codon:yes stop_codon:yes gene_type:complete
MSTIEVNKITPVDGGTTTTLGDSGDTFTVPTGAGLTVTDEVKTNKISPASGTTFTLGDSGDTFNIPAGATIANAGTATGFSSGDNTPSFLAYASSGTTVGNDTNAQIAFQTEVWDTDSAYDNSTHYRFTVPSGEAGKYFFGASLELNITSSTGSVRTQIWKNGTTFVRNNDGGNSYYHNVATYGVVDMAVGDYVEVRCYQNSGGIKTTQTGTADNYFFGYKLAGV